MKLKNRIVVCVSVFTIVLTLWFVFFTSSKNENRKHVSVNMNVCTSRRCRQESARIRNCTNPAMNPCTNFYEHACGNFMKEHKQRGYGYSSQLILLERAINATLRKDLNSRISSKDSVAMRTIKSFYQKCSSISDDNRRPVLDYIASLGGWPLLEKKKSKDNSGKPSRFYRTLIRMRQAGLWVNVPFDIINNHAANIIEVKPRGTLTYHNKDFLVTADEISGIAHFLGGDPLTILDQIYDMLVLEMEMKKNYKSHRTKGKLFTIGDLKLNFPGINWEILLKEIRVKTGKEHVMVYNVLQAEKISDLMLAYENAFTNFIMWRAISEYSKFLTHEMEFWQVYNFKNVSIDELNEYREKQCYDMIVRTIGLNAFYVSKYVQNARKGIEGIYGAIKVIAEKFFQSRAVNDATALNAIFQLKTLRTMLGNSNLLLYEDIIDTYYRLITYEERNLFQFYMNIVRTEENLEAHLRRHSKDPLMGTDDDIMIVYPNAEYNAVIHALLIPGGLFNLPFYHRARPNYLNFGGIGFLLGHETAHATKYHDNERESCLINAFSDYNLSKIDKSINGELTLPENWADYLGIRFAYDAYKAWRNNQTKEERKLEDFENYTSEQMFWLSAAGIFCEYGRNEFLEKILSRGVHSLAEARINVGFANNPDFARDFNCPLGSAMNPRHKC